MSAICIIYRMLCQTLSPTSFRLKKQIKTNKKSGKEERRNKSFEDIQFKLCYGNALSRYFDSWILPCYIEDTQPRVFQRINSVLLRCLSIGCAASGSNQERMLRRFYCPESVKEHYNNSAPVTGRAVLKYLFSY
jgi:hypothetical protein